VPGSTAQASRSEHRVGHLRQRVGSDRVHGRERDGQSGDKAGEAGDDRGLDGRLPSCAADRCACDGCTVGSGAQRHDTAGRLGLPCSRQAPAHRPGLPRQALPPAANQTSGVISSGRADSGRVPAPLLSLRSWVPGDGWWRAPGERPVSLGADWNSRPFYDIHFILVDCPRSVARAQQGHPVGKPDYG
jgi:hypothetical protein